VKALTSRLASRRDYELVQAWMSVLLRLHFDVVMDNEAVRGAVEEWKRCEEEERARLDRLVGYCSGVVGFLRNPRS
jgi:U3 small nucleolar RNA-associated protein 21